jgi:hypothetical protein
MMIGNLICKTRSKVPLPALFFTATFKIAVSKINEQQRPRKPDGETPIRALHGLRRSNLQIEPDDTVLFAVNRVVIPLAS